MKLLVGLGNPGEQYTNTRHNVGFFVVNEIQRKYGFSEYTEKTKFSSLISEGMINNEKMLLAKPLTFMNLSGKAVQDLVHFYDLDLKDILVIHDDIDLELGTYKRTENSRSAGQRGVQNIIDILGTKNFPRLRIGVGPVAQHMDTHDFVLQRFSNEELQILEELKDEIIKSFVNL